MDEKLEKIIAEMAKDLPRENLKIAYRSGLISVGKFIEEMAKLDRAEMEK